MVDRLTPLVALMKTRVDQLGPKPEKGESPDISKERASLEKAYSDSDDLFKRAKVLVVKAQQDATYIGKRQRALFTTSAGLRDAWRVASPLLEHRPELHPYEPGTWGPEQGCRASCSPSLGRTYP